MKVCVKKPKTKSIQASIHISTAVSPSALGEFDLMLLKMLTRTRKRKRVMRSAMRPVTMSGGMRKEIQETITKRPEGR